MALATSTVAALSLAASAVGAFGAIQQGQAASKQANFQAAVAQQQAERERLQAASDEQDYRRKQSRLMASKRAVGGASGVDTTTGSPLFTSEDFAGEAELNALRIRNGGEVRANRAEQFAELKRAQGSSAKTGSYFRAGASLLQGVSNAYG